MPAVSVPDPLVLPALAEPDPSGPTRAVVRVSQARRAVEGAGFVVWRAFPLTQADPAATDPFYLLDQMGPIVYGPDEAVGAPWHPHRGFETVTYMLDGEMAHHDSTGGGGVIGEGDTQWMTAGSGILHDEVPTEALRRAGGLTHGVQLWVNLPARLKMTPPAYQAIEGTRLALARSTDGGVVVRIISGQVGGVTGPGGTQTPIAYAHATLTPGAGLRTTWNPDFNALVYVLSGQVAVAERPVTEHQLAVLGPGHGIELRADEAQADDVEVLLLGGRPIAEPIAQYGPFLMNTDAEIRQAVDDYQAGRMGTIPPSLG